MSPLGDLSGPSWFPLGPSGGDIDQRRGVPNKLRLFGARQIASWVLLGRSWGAPGRSGGRRGAPLGPSYGRCSVAMRQGETAIHIEKLPVFDGYRPLGGPLGRLRGQLEPSWGGLGASWRHAGCHLEPSWAIVRHLGSHLGRSGAALEPSWAILDILTACRGIDPSPKGDKWTPPPSSRLLPLAVPPSSASPLGWSGRRCGCRWRSPPAKRSW